jgi:hypothetical protein
MASEREDDDSGQKESMKYREIIADNLIKPGSAWVGCQL